MWVPFVDAVNVSFGGNFDVSFRQQKFADRLYKHCNKRYLFHGHGKWVIFFQPYRIQHEPVHATSFAQRQNHHGGTAVQHVASGHHVSAFLKSVIDVGLVAFVGFSANKTHGGCCCLFFISRKLMVLCDFSFFFYETAKMFRKWRVNLSKISLLSDSITEETKSVIYCLEINAKKWNYQRDRQTFKRKTRVQRTVADK